MFPKFLGTDRFLFLGTKILQKKSRNRTEPKNRMATPSVRMFGDWYHLPTPWLHILIVFFFCDHHLFLSCLAYFCLITSPTLCTTTSSVTHIIELSERVIPARPRHSSRVSYAKILCAILTIPLHDVLLFHNLPPHHTQYKIIELEALYMGWEHKRHD